LDWSNGRVLRFLEDRGVAEVVDLRVLVRAVEGDELGRPAQPHGGQASEGVALLYDAWRDGAQHRLEGPGHEVEVTGLGRPGHPDPRLDALGAVLGRERRRRRRAVVDADRGAIEEEPGDGVLQRPGTTQCKPDMGPVRPGPAEPREAVGAYVAFRQEERLEAGAGV